MKIAIVLAGSALLAAQAASAARTPLWVVWPTSAEVEPGGSSRTGCTGSSA